MAISFVGAASAAGTSVALPAHQPGDLIVIWAYQGTSNANTIGIASGFTATAGQSGVGANSQSSRLGFKIATSSAEVSGEWSNAEETVAHVYRGVDPINPIGGSSTMTGVADVTFAAVALAVTDGTSWVATFAGWRTSSVSLGNATFNGLTQRANISSGTVSRSTTFDTANVVASFPGVSSTGATGFRYRTVAVELRAGAAAAPSPINGQVSITFGQITGGAVGQLPIAGSTAGMLAPLTGAAMAALKIVGRVGGTLDGLTGVTIAKLPIDADVDGQLESLTGGGVGTLTIKAHAAVVFDPLTGSADAELIGQITGEVIAAFQPLTGAAYAQLAVTGSGMVTFDELTGSADAELIGQITGEVTIRADRIIQGFERYRIINGFERVRIIQ